MTAAKAAIVTTQRALANGASKSKTLLIVTIRTALGANAKTIITFLTRPVKFCPVSVRSQMSKSAIAGVKINFTAESRKYKFI